MSKLLEEVRDEMINGKGFILFQGFPVNEWGMKKSAVAYMGLGSHFGYVVSQNGKGHLLGHVKDLGEDAKQWDRVRFYRTNARYAKPTHHQDLFQQNNRIGYQAKVLSPGKVSTPILWTS